MSEDGGRASEDGAIEYAQIQEQGWLVEQGIRETAIAGPDMAFGRQKTAVAGSSLCIRLRDPFQASLQGEVPGYL